jgi:hypothetical protein
MVYVYGKHLHGSKTQFAFVKFSPVFLAHLRRGVRGEKLQARRTACFWGKPLTAVTAFFCDFARAAGLNALLTIRNYSAPCFIINAGHVP